MGPSTAGGDLTIPRRFRGPARSGNGGYTAGSVAERLQAHAPCEAVEVTLRRPPPLDTAMALAVGTTDAVLSWEGACVAEARGVDGDLTPVDEVSAAEAEAAMARFPGLHSHPFPGCFACGPDRAVGDGLRIFPGRVAEDLVASLWVPHESLPAGSGVVWAALDCIGGWSDDLEGRPSVLGRMAARVDALPVVGETHVVVGRRLGAEGRKTFTASTLYDGDGRVVATARHTWVQVDPAAFN
jgi:hypothetical protein